MKLLQILLCALCWNVGFQASAYLRPSIQWRGHEEQLARVLLAEADDSRPDWAALLWVLEHRSQEIGESPDRADRGGRFVSGASPGGSHLRLISEAEARRRGLTRVAHQFVLEWLDGDVPDPCPGALYFWRLNVTWEGIERLSCGATRNRFGRDRRER